MRENCAWWSETRRIASHSSELSKGAFTPVFRPATKRFFYAQKLIVLGCTLAPAQAPGLNLFAIEGHREIRNRDVFRLTTSMGHDGAKVIGLGQLNGFKSFTERADLIDLHQNGVGGLAF